MSENKEIGTSGVVRENWSEGDGTGSDRAGAGHEMQKAEFDERGRYSGSLQELENVEELEPANPLTVTQEERQEIVEDIEARAEAPKAYADLSEHTQSLIDEDGWDNVNHEISGAREHLNHEEYDALDAAIGGLPQALNEKLLVALGSGEFEDLPELVLHLADGLTATQTAHLRRAIEEMPARIREEIGF